MPVGRGFNCRAAGGRLYFGKLAPRLRFRPQAAVFGVRPKFRRPPAGEIDLYWRARRLADEQPQQKSWREAANPPTHPCTREDRAPARPGMVSAWGFRLQELPLDRLLNKSCHPVQRSCLLVPAGAHVPGLPAAARIQPRGLGHTGPARPAVGERNYTVDRSKQHYINSASMVCDQCKIDVTMDIML